MPALGALVRQGLVAPRRLLRPPAACAMRILAHGAGPLPLTPVRRPADLFVLLVLEEPRDLGDELLALVAVEILVDGRAALGDPAHEPDVDEHPAYPQDDDDRDFDLVGAETPIVPLSMTIMKMKSVQIRT